MQVLFNSEVVEVATDTSTTVALKGGNNLQGDVIVVADGCDSAVRALTVGASEFVAGDENNLFISFQVPTDMLRLDEELRTLAESSSVSAFPRCIKMFGFMHFSVDYLVRRRLHRQREYLRGRTEYSANICLRHLTKFYTSRAMTTSLLCLLCRNHSLDTWSVKGSGDLGH